MPFINSEPDLSVKQAGLLKLCRKKTGTMKFILVSGTRWSGKSVGCGNAIADHLWHTKNGAALMLCYTAGTAATSGIWNEVTEKVIPEWIAADFGMQWADKGAPKIHGATKKMMCAVINKHGRQWLDENPDERIADVPAWGISKLELDSLDDEREVEKKFKSRYYSLIYWSEASEFKSELTMTTMMMALRIVGLPDEEHVLLIDTNPAESGESHFLYKYFYEMRVSDEVSEEERAIQQCLHLTEWTMDDNPYITENKKAIIRSTYKDKPSQYSRYILGRWVKVVEKGLFIKQFSLAIHVVGDASEKDPEILVPMDGCSELIVGLDPGGVNPFAYIIEKCILHEEKKDISVFRYLDELGFIGEDISVEEFTIMLLEKMDFWEKEISEPMSWSFWSDRSALDFKESIAQRTVADEMFSVSNGRIKLVGVDKGRGSVGNRIRLWRKLLVQQRVIICRAKCPKLVEMCENINCGKVPDTISNHSIYKHSFDAGTYPVAKECWDELQDNIITLRTLARPKTKELLSISM